MYVDTTLYLRGKDPSADLVSLNKIAEQTSDYYMFSRCNPQSGATAT